jgi:hypothetical protein
MARRMSSRVLVFVAMMSALGNVLSGISILLTPFIPQIPLGPVTMSVAFDLSHLTTFLSALYGGPSTGGLTGLIGGLIAAYVFGFSKGNLVNGFAIPIGKAITGITASLVYRAIGGGRGKWALALSPSLAYVPEAIYTSCLFLVILPLVIGIPALVFYPILVAILIKAWVEMLIIGWIVTVLSRNKAFGTTIGGFFREGTSSN